MFVKFFLIFKTGRSRTYRVNFLIAGLQNSRDAAGQCFLSFARIYVWSFVGLSVPDPLTKRKMIET